MKLPGFFHAKSPLEKIKERFSFLVDEFGFQLVTATLQPGFIAPNFLAYRNDNSGVQVEICGDNTWFHCEIRRLIHGTPPPYSDKENNTGFESLAILESNDTEKYLADFSVSSIGLEAVLANTVSLFKRNKEFFTTGKWIDVWKLNELKDDAFEKKFSFRPDRNTPSFFAELKRQSIPFFAERQYQLMTDSDERSPFEKNRLVDYLVFQKNDRTIKISQADWRDEYFIYQVEVNGRQVFDIDIRNQNNLSAIGKLIEKLKEQL